jgi:hypothetical protein
MNLIIWQDLQKPVQLSLSHRFYYKFPVLAEEKE